MRIVVVTMIFSVLWTSATSGEVTNKWTVADRETVRLAPSSFTALPEATRTYLKARRCTIPQTPWDQQPHNVIKGHFKNPGQVDWAVLCSVANKSRILVFWGDPAIAVSEIPGSRSDDKKWLQGGGEGEIDFSRVISTVDSNYITDHSSWYGGKVPQLLDHEGIDDAFSEKGSRVHYWYDGEWLQLTGAD